MADVLRHRHRRGSARGWLLPMLGFSTCVLKLLEDALVLADEKEDGKTGYLIERALDEARAHRFRFSESQ